MIISLARGNSVPHQSIKNKLTGASNNGVGSDVGLVVLAIFAAFGKM